MVVCQLILPLQICLKILHVFLFPFVMMSDVFQLAPCCCRGVHSSPRDASGRGVLIGIYVKIQSKTRIPVPVTSIFLVQSWKRIIMFARITSHTKNSVWIIYIRIPNLLKDGNQLQYHVLILLVFSLHGQSIIDLKHDQTEHVFCCREVDSSNLLWLVFW